MRVRVFLSLLAALLVLSLGAGTSAAAASTRSFSTHLSGAAEVPGHGDPHGAGVARITVDLHAGTICYTLHVTGIAPATAAHIHLGAVGTAGPVVVTLAPPATGSSSGCVAVSPALATAILNHPELYYVNVHNAAFPAGAIRGQLGR